MHEMPMPTSPNPEKERPYRKFPPEFNGKTHAELQAWHEEAGRMIAKMKKAGMEDEAFQYAMTKRDELYQSYLEKVKN